MSFEKSNTTDSAKQNAVNIANTIGKAGLHTLAPDNFEYYMCSLELLDGSSNTKGFMNFVVMPNNITESKRPIVSITKTNRGVVTLFNDSFVPRDISIQGTFGRKFRLLLGFKEPEESSFFNGNMGFDAANGDVLIKTGYGLIKMLKSMIDESYKLDENGYPCILIFNNYALNTHYIVEIVQASFSQSIENNIMWYYNLEMKAVAPAEAVKRQDSNSNKTFLGTVASGAIAKAITNILTDVSKEALGSF